MKSTKFILIFLASVAFASAQKPYFNQDHLDFPSITELDEVYTIEEIEMISDDLNSKIGSYPPSFKNKRDRKKTYRKWSKAILSAEKLKGAKRLSH